MYIVAMSFVTGKSDRFEVSALLIGKSTNSGWCHSVLRLLCTTFYPSSLPSTSCFLSFLVCKVYIHTWFSEKGLFSSYAHINYLIPFCCGFPQSYFSCLLAHLLSIFFRVLLQNTVTDALTKHSYGCICTYTNTRKCLSSVPTLASPGWSRWRVWNYARPVLLTFLRSYPQNCWTTLCWTFPFTIMYEL